MDQSRIAAQTDGRKAMKHSRLLFWGLVLAIVALIIGLWPLGHVVLAQGNTWHVATHGSEPIIRK